jgi:Homeodomain-like domain
MRVMPKKKHHIQLSAEEREQLETIVRKGKASAHRQRHARILVLADTNGPEGGWSDSRIAGGAHTSIPSVERVRRICVEHGLERALEPKDPERVYVRKLDGKAEAQLIAQSCGPAPEGRARWTLRLLAARLVELEIVEAISHETVRRTLKKTNSSRGRKSSG